MSPYRDHHFIKTMTSLSPLDPGAIISQVSGLDSSIYGKPTGFIPMAPSRHLPGMILRPFPTGVLHAAISAALVLADSKFYATMGTGVFHFSALHESAI
jgi:hypothetical protein